MKHASKFACLLFLFSIFACAAPAATEAIPTAIVPAASTETPAPASSATASPSPTEPTLQLEVIEWHLWSDLAQFEGDASFTYVEFLVRNPYDFPVRAFDPAVRLINNSGEIVHRTGDVVFHVFSDAGWNIILPGETVPGRFWGLGLAEISEWETFEIAGDVEEVTPIAYTTDLRIEVGEFSDYSTGNEPFYSAQGTVTNTSGQPLKTILMRVIVRNADGNFVGSGLIGVIGDFFDGRYQSLEPGSVHEFTIGSILDPLLKGASLQFDVTGFGIIAQ